MIKNLPKQGQYVKPFLKWAGGKSQLLKEIEVYYHFKNGIITKYAEPLLAVVLFFLTTERLFI